MPAPDALKKTIRSDMRSALRELTDERRRSGSRAACQRLVAQPAFRDASMVMLYLPLESEVDVTPIAIRCFQLGKSVCVPRVNWERRDMKAIEVSSFDDHVMDCDAHNVRSPRGGCPVVPSAIDLIVVPGLAFDTDGNRLGRGGGFYDRFLGRLRRNAHVAAIAFEEQIIDQVPTEACDVKVDQVVTDRRVTNA